MRATPQTVAPKDLDLGLSRLVLFGNILKHTQNDIQQSNIVTGYLERAPSASNLQAIGGADDEQATVDPKGQKWGHSTHLVELFHFMFCVCVPSG
jgi:hypothetical protein